MSDSHDVRETADLKDTGQSKPASGRRKSGSGDRKSDRGSRWVLVGAGLLIGAGIGLLALAGLGLLGVAPLPEFLGGRPAVQAALMPEVSAPAPDFELQTLDGRTVRLADLKGKAVLVNFWATWCGPCRIEMPLIEKYHQRYSPDFQVLAVNAGESPEQVQAFVDEMGLTFDVLLDPREEVTNSVYRIRAFPSSYFIDTDGVIRYQHIGILNESQLTGYLTELGVMD